MPLSIPQLRVEGVGTILEDPWWDCGPTANPRLECDLADCCTQYYPSNDDDRADAFISDENPVGDDLRV